MADEKLKLNGAPASSHQEDYSKLKFEELQLGVWKLRFASAPPTFVLSPAKQWASFKAATLLIWDHCRRIFDISPKLFSMFILYKIWSGIETSVALQLSNNLLRATEERLVAGKSNGREIIYAVLLCVMCAMFEACSYWYKKKIQEKLEICVTRHYEMIILETNLGLDLPAFKAGGNTIEVSASQAWWSIKNIIDSLTSDLRLVTELLTILHLSLNTGGPLFALLCLIQPLFAGFSVRNIWGQAVLGFIDNPHYQRMKSIQNMVHEDKYREDLISGGLGRWIADGEPDTTSKVLPCQGEVFDPPEYRQANQKLGVLSNAHPLRGHYQSSYDRSLALPVFLKALGELPMIFCAISVVLYPEIFTVSSLAMLQQSATTLRHSVRSALDDGREVKKSVIKLRKLYNSTSISNERKSGDTSYPRTEKMESVLVNPGKGMSFQLRNVSFSYIGSQNKTPALTNLSLTIKPGQLVVIVGANGSGKSTLIRILSRLYDPTDGEMLIDDLPCKDYRIDDLHKSTVLLSQDNNVYPLSLGENIGLGFPECASDAGMLSEAARLGGARDFIEKLDQGMNTTLSPYIDSFSLNIREEKNHPLYKEMLSLAKEIDISGGERQRIVAARSFMRFNSGKVKFVAVDEPSSALDAKGELQLFNNLLSVREGKTMIFVTHRFGHLTKHADLILCMKEGSIIESGTHSELMDKKGEYMSLFNIQAKAFSD